MASQQRRRMLAAVVALLVGTTALLIGTPNRISAADPFHLFSLFRNKCGDVKSYICDECGRIDCPDKECIIRRPVKECVVGKKKVFDCKIKYEYVSIPETRYRWKKTYITEEIPCPYCHPVCKTEEGQRCFGVEKWEKFPKEEPPETEEDSESEDDPEAEEDSDSEGDLVAVGYLEAEESLEAEGFPENCSCFGEGICAACQELHCRRIVPQIEKTEIKCCQQGSYNDCCQHELGETTVKVKYWSCVKEPYTVYRRVKRPICVKQPRYEKVEVPITRYVCEHCDVTGNHACSEPGCASYNATGCPACEGVGCDQCVDFTNIR